jgi:TIR domain-containing protein
MSQIFISYRREDSAGYAGRLGEALERRLGDGAVFRDVDALQPGQDFVDAIAVRLRDAHVCLVLIGREWLDARGRSGRRRLEEPNDYVLHEIATALARPDVLVIPVLVEGTRMPTTEELPESIQVLARRHAASLRDESWDADVDRLVSVVRKATGSQGASDAIRVWVRRHRVSVAGIAAVALVALVLAQRWNPQVPSEANRTVGMVRNSTGVPGTAPTPASPPEAKPPEVTEHPVPGPETVGRSATSPTAKPTARPAATPVRAPVPAVVTLQPTVTAPALVKKAIADYERAAEALDVEGVRRIWPAAPGGLRNSYRNLMSQAIDLDCAEPAISSDTATIACRERIRSVGAGRIALPVETNTATFALRRNGETWEISRISRQSVP